ncbi:hypothetical protein [Olleya sp. R77988]|uniref:hypothetical protein n=1 Tax=Olleya sp. R77988 TaxID=3093875 RepID=UPI0037CA9F04
MYLVSAFLVLTISLLIVQLVERPNNLFLSHFYFILQFVFLSLFYRELFTKKQIRYLHIVSTLVITTLIIQYTNRPSLFYKFNLLEILITSLPLVIYSVIHLYNSLTKPGKYMYINAGVLIYLTTSTLIFILGDFLASQKGVMSVKGIWFINKILYVGYLILICIEWKKNLWKTKK